MSRYYNQEKSQLPKTGNNKSHEICKDIIKAIFKKRKYETLDYSEAVLEVIWKFSDEDSNIVLDKGKYYHQYDLWFRKKIAPDLYQEVIIEVDGGYHKPENVGQQNRDKKAESYINFLYPDCFFIRVGKEEIVKKSGVRILSDSEIENYINNLVKKKYKYNREIL